MKKAAVLFISIAGAFSVAGTMFTQDIQHETTAINIEIPVRVFKGEAFIDNLTLDDFELFEDGKPQTVEAFYLIKKANIERKEAAKEYAPPTARNFYLFFEIGEYDPKIGESLDYFVKTVLLPGDNLTIVTPMKTYRMKGELFNIVGRAETYAQVVGILRRDIQIGYSESRGILREMSDLASVMASEVRATNSNVDIGALELLNPQAAIPVEATFEAGSFEEKLVHYTMLLSRLASLRLVDQQKLLNFAEHLKAVQGQKDVFLFYQKEYVPKIDPRLVELLSTKYSDRMDITQTLSTTFGIYRRETSFDVDFVKKAYSDSSTSIHFLYVTKSPERVEGVVMEEQSEDIFAPFLEMAKATGGYSASSANVAAVMRAAVLALENYYLLYYTPKDYKNDGKFHNVTVRIKNGDYRISHRLGYIGD